MEPRQATMKAKMGQDGAKTAQVRAKKCQDRDGRPGVRTKISTPLGLRAQDGAKAGHGGAKMGQDGAKTAQIGARKCQDGDGRPGV